MPLPSCQPVSETSQFDKKSVIVPSCPSGLSCNPVQNEGRAKWYPPENSSDLPKLQVHNSLNDRIDLFVPRVNRTVTWYTCGPTVYDSNHMGHARAYLTFDILRRIMQDYFHYDVFYQVNITDVDDKIILRARQNKLVKDYTEKVLKEKDFGAVESYVQVAMVAMRQKLERKVVDLKEPLPEGTPSKQVEKREEALKEAQFKEDQFGELETAVRNVLEKNEKSIEELITASRDALAAQLDKDHGSSVTDRKIYEDHARKFEKQFFEDMEALGVREPDVVTRVTEYVPQIVDYILGIMANGCAYESNGSVYFNTSGFKSKGFEYRKLKPGKDTTAEEMAEGEGALGAGGDTEKRHPNDFALWKASKPGEPSWESPWGAGRPGWHIECSVMASDIIGENLDIHGGGVDLMFPHHDNEMAQAEAFHGCCQWVNYFLHAGHLHIKGLKMSKSLKNFITIRQALQEHSPRQLRMMFLMQPWNKPMNYSDQTVDDAKAKEKYFKNFFGSVKSVLRNDFVRESQGFTPADRALSAKLDELMGKVHSAFLDNFKTNDVIQYLVELVMECNKYLTTETKPKNLLVKKVAIYVTKILRVLGVVEGSDKIGFGESASGGASKEDTISPYVDAFVDFREQVRNAAKSKGGPGDFLKACDEVRDETMAKLGIRIEDSADKSIWKMDDPEAIRKEIKDKREKAREAAAKKLAAKFERLTTEVQKAKQASIPKTEWFKVGANVEKWGSYDEDGKPLTTKDGKELSKSQQKSIKKESNSQDKVTTKVLKAAGEQGIEKYIDHLEQQLAGLKLELSK